MLRSPQNSLDARLEEAIADSIASDLIDGAVHVLDRRDLARRAAITGFRHAVDLAVRTVAEMAADHEDAGRPAQGAVLREAVKKLEMMPDDVP